MKTKKLLALIPLLASLMLMSSCGFTNPGDSLGGGTESDSTESDTSSTDNGQTETANTVIGSTEEVDDGEEEVPNEAEEVSGDMDIETAGDYYISGTQDGKISVTCEGVTLYLDNATLTNEKKVIESDYGLTITLIGTNSIANSYTDSDGGKNAIDCAGDLIVNGTGSLSISSTKNGIKANSISVKKATLEIDAEKDGLHAEIESYDSLDSAPSFSNDDGGYVLIDSADITIDSVEDGIQADTYIYVKGDSTVLDITTNGGAPNTVTETSSDNGSGKGMKAGLIDWGENNNEIDGEYLIMIEAGAITINANDDAIHSNYEVNITGGTLDITTGDDAVHGDELLYMTGGTVTAAKCYEGMEAAKIEISGGTVDVTATDDGINAADGTQNAMNVANTNCRLTISGGSVKVNSGGDGLDSNGYLYITGGEVYVSGPTSGDDAALDADGSIVVNGGYLFACGALGMVETPATNSAQYCVSFATNSAISANTTLSLTDSSGNTIFYFTVPKACQSVIISCPELTKGSTYYIYGGSSSLCSFTISSIITSVGSTSTGNQGNMPGGGGAPGWGWH